MFFGFFVFTVILLVIIKAVSKKLDYPDNSDAGKYASDEAEEEPVYKAEPEQVMEPEPKPGPVCQERPAPIRVDRLFGLIGKPLAHSASMVLFKKRFRNQHISADYKNFELDNIEDLPELVNSQPKLCGLNVTVPYKQDVIRYLDRLDPSAESVGAVNVIKIDRSGDKPVLIGYNTDCQAFMDSIKPFVGDRKKALILGTGGVSKAVKHALDLMGIESRFVSRSSSFDILGYYELSPSLMEEFTIIVNCTPVGMWPDVDHCPDIPYTFLSSDHLLYDVVYNPEDTLFMKKGRDHGATVIGGTDMFELQAGATWEIWNN